MYLHSWIAILFACVALIAGWGGIHRWDDLNRSQRWITMFCAGSGVLQLVQSWQRYLHHHTGFISHAWTLWSILALLSAGIESAKADWRPTMRKIQVAFLVFWAVYHWQSQEMFGIANAPHMVMTMILMVFGCAVLLSAVDAPFSDQTVPGLWIAGGLMLGQGADLFMYSETLGWLNLNVEGIKTLMVFRNSVWVFAYFFFWKATLCPSFRSSLHPSR